MKLKRCMAIILAGTMAVTGLAGCSNQSNEKEESTDIAQDNLPVDEDGNISPFGKYEEPITVEIVQSINPTSELPEGDSTTDNYYTRYVKENMNIDISIKWQAADANFTQKFNLAIAANDLPDVMVVSASDFIKLKKSDLIEDLTPYYNQFASDTIKADIDATDGMAIEAASVDGKIYGLPGVNAEGDSYSLMWIRQDWLDELGLEVPKTIEEMETVAKAFVDNQMGGDHTVGVLAASSGSALYSDFISPLDKLYKLDGIFQAYKSWPGFWIEEEEGNVVYGSITSETKEALSKLQEMYENGILDQEIGIRKSADEAWKSGQVGILFSPWWHGYMIAEAAINDPDAEWMAYAAPVAEDGQWYPKMGTPTTGFVVVRKGYEHPEAAILFNNFLRRDEGIFAIETTLTVGYYPGRIVVAAIDEIEFSAEVLQKYMNGEEVPEYDPVSYKLLDADIESLKEVKDEPYDDLSIETWHMDHPNFGRLYSLLVGTSAVLQAEKEGIINKQYSLTYQQTETIEKKWTNLKKKEDETFLKIIIGEESIDYFDTFVEEWKAEGGDEITAEVQALSEK